MNEAPDAERESAGYIRLPWPLVGAGLFVILAALLGFGLFANRNLRPQTAAAPTAVVVEPATATALPVIAVTQVETPTPEPRVIVTATAVTATPAPAPAVPTAATATATTVAAPAATPRPTVNPELAAEVGSAYQEYWDIRAEALYELDASRLEQVMAGDHLAAVQDRISELRAEGRAIETEVEHKYVVVQASTDSAEVADTYLDQSVYVDAQTHAPITSPTGQRLTELYSLTKVDGTWRVVDLVRGT